MVADVSEFDAAGLRGAASKEEYLVLPRSRLPVFSGMSALHIFPSFLD